jgi:Response regulator of the LytR/AlgR family
MRSEARQILVVEDNYFQAEEISRFIRGIGGKILGPVASVEMAWPFVSRTQAAVLDIDLGGSLVFPLADTLIERRVPIIFYTGWSVDRDLPRRFWNVPLIRKPFQDIRDIAVVTMVAHSAEASNEITDILPKLRVSARLIFSDPMVADRLVERLLKDAIAEVADGQWSDDGDTRTRWLIKRMRTIVNRCGTELMN